MTEPKTVPAAAPAPQQARSRATLERLLSATIQALDAGGLDAALVPAIAQRAGVAPASIYRRFRDKDALLRAAFLHVLERSQQGNRERLPRLLLRPTLEASARRLVALVLAQYRQHPHLLRALQRFVEADGDGPFARDVRAKMAANVDTIVEALLPLRAEIAQRATAKALRFAVLQAFSAAEAYALEQASVWHTAPRILPKEFAAQLTRAFVAYLRYAPR